VQSAEGRCGGSRRESGQAASSVPQFRHSASRQLDHGDQQRRVRHRLLHAHGGREVEHLHQRPRETRYFYQDLDMRGGRLTGTGRYTITFKETPPVKGFWSITLYNQQHFFATIALNRFSLGTKSKGLRFEPDGSLVIHVQNERPTDDKLSNWLPAPPDEFSLYIRAYWPLEEIAEGRWTPPPVVPA
jgi:hypothetical protein